MDPGDKATMRGANAVGVGPGGDAENAARLVGIDRPGSDAPAAKAPPRRTSSQMPGRNIGIAICQPPRLSNQTPASADPAATS